MFKFSGYSSVCFKNDGVRLTFLYRMPTIFMLSEQCGIGLFDHSRKNGCRKIDISPYHSFRSCGTMMGGVGSHEGKRLVALAAFSILQEYVSTHSLQMSLASAVDET